MKGINNGGSFSQQKKMRSQWKQKSGIGQVIDQEMDQNTDNGPEQQHENPSIALEGKGGWWSRTVSARRSVQDQQIIEYDEIIKGRQANVGLSSTRGTNVQEQMENDKQNQIERKLQQSTNSDIMQARMIKRKKKMSDYSPEQPFQRVEDQAVKQRYNVSRGSFESISRPTQLFQDENISRTFNEKHKSNTLNFNFNKQFKGAEKADGDLGLAKVDFDNSLDDHKTQVSNIHTVTLQKTTSNQSNTQFDALGRVSDHQQYDSQFSQARFSQQILHTPPELQDFGQDQDRGLTVLPNQRLKPGHSNSIERPRELNSFARFNRQVDGPKIISKSLQRVPQEQSAWIEEREEIHGERNATAVGVINKTINQRSKLTQSLDQSIFSRIIQKSVAQQYQKSNPIEESRTQNLKKQRQASSHFGKLTFEATEIQENGKQQMEEYKEEPLQQPQRHSIEMISQPNSRRIPTKSKRPQPLQNPRRSEAANGQNRDQSSCYLSTVLSEQNARSSSMSGNEKFKPASYELLASNRSVKVKQQFQPKQNQRKVPSINIKQIEDSKILKDKDLVSNEFENLTDRGQKRAANLIKSLSHAQKTMANQNNCNVDQIAQSQMNSVKQVNTVKGSMTIARFEPNGEKVGMKTPNMYVDPILAGHCRDENEMTLSHLKSRKAVQFDKYQNQCVPGGPYREKPELKLPTQHKTTTRSENTESEMPSTHRPRQYQMRSSTQLLSGMKKENKVSPQIQIIEEPEKPGNLPTQFNQGGYVQKVKSKSQTATAKQSRKSQSHRGANNLQVLPSKFSKTKLPSNTISDKSDHSYEFQDLESSMANPKNLKKEEKEQDQNEGEVNFDNEMQFDDAIEKFVDIIRMTTQVTEINIFTRQLVQIYYDVPGGRDVQLTPEQRASLQEKLRDFGREVTAKAKKMRQERAPGSVSALASESKGVNQNLQELRAVGVKRGQYASRYRMLETSHWKRYMAEEEDDLPWELKKRGDKNKDNELASDLAGYHIFFAKIAISIDKKDFEEYQQYSSRRSLLQDQVNNDEEYLIFQCLFSNKAPEYYAEMFMNMAQNFLIADEELRKELEVLIQITRQMTSMQDEGSDQNRNHQFYQLPQKQMLQMPSDGNSMLTLVHRQTQSQPQMQIHKKTELIDREPKQIETTYSNNETVYGKRTLVQDDDDAVNEEFTAEEVRTLNGTAEQQIHSQRQPAIITTHHSDRNIISIENQESFERQMELQQPMYSPSRVPTIQLQLPRKTPTLSQEQQIQTPKDSQQISTNSKLMKSEPQVTDQNQDIRNVQRKEASKGRQKRRVMSGYLNKYQASFQHRTGKSKSGVRKPGTQGQLKEKKVLVQKLGQNKLKSQTRGGVGQRTSSNEASNANGQRFDQKRPSRVSGYGSLGSVGNDASSINSLNQEMQFSPYIASMQTGSNLKTEGTTRNLIENQQSTFPSNFEHQMNYQNVKQKHGIANLAVPRSIDGTENGQASLQNIMNKELPHVMKNQQSSIFHSKSFSVSTNGRRMQMASPTKGSDSSHKPAQDYFNKVNKRYTASGSSQKESLKIPTAGINNRQQRLNLHKKSDGKIKYNRQNDMKNAQNLQNKQHNLNQNLTNSSGKHQFMSQTRGSQQGLLQGHELSFQGSLNSVRASQKGSKVQSEHPISQLEKLPASTLMPSALPPSTLNSPSPSTGKLLYPSQSFQTTQQTVQIDKYTNRKIEYPNQQYLHPSSIENISPENSLKNFGGAGGNRQRQSEFDFSFGDYRSSKNRLGMPSAREQSRFNIMSGQGGGSSSQN